MLNVAAITDFVNSRRKKVEIENILLKAELTAATSGVAIHELLNEYAKALAKGEPFISQEIYHVRKLLLSNKPRYVAYSKYVNKGFLTILKTAEERKKPVNSLLEIYAPIYELSRKYDIAIRTSLRFPLVGFVVFSVVFSVVLRVFKTMKDQLSPYSTFIINYFPYISATIFFSLLYLLLVHRQKIPFLRSVYHRLNSILAISMTALFYNMGISTQDVLPIIRVQFKLPASTKKRIDINTLIQEFLAAKFITPLLGADIQMGVTYREPKKVFKTISNDMMFEAEQLSAPIGDAVKNIALFISAIPAILAMIVFFDFMYSVSNKIH